MEKVDVNLIDPNPEQPRVDFDPDELAGLAQSIAEVGVINPVVVYQEGDRYILLDGERRLRASIMAGLAEIPVSVRPRDEGKEKKLGLALIANLQRDDLNPIEEARAYRRLADEFGMNGKEISSMTGKSGSYISERLNLLKLDAPIQELVASRAFTSNPSICRALLDIQDPELRISLARRYAVRNSANHVILKGLRMASAGTQKPKRIIAGGDGPALYVAERQGAVVGQLVGLDSIRLDQATVEQAVIKTCQDCPLVDMASESTCRECPLVEFLKNMRRVQE
jgi:ParB family chromosome partitioning protein